MIALFLPPRAGNCAQAAGGFPEKTLRAAIVIYDGLCRLLYRYF